MPSDLLFAGVLIVLALTIAIGIVVLGVRIERLKKALEDARIKGAINLQGAERQQMVLTRQLSAQAKHKPVGQLPQELKQIFADKVQRLYERYPTLTDADMTILVMLGIGLDNQAIITYLDMTKRTYYKRRQITSKRLGINATELDTYARENINPHYSNI